VSRRTIERSEALAPIVVAATAACCPAASLLARSPASTQPRTSRRVSTSISRRVREIVEWSGVDSSDSIATKRCSEIESASRQAISGSESSPSN
jgi:hypothetical protein